MKKIYNILGCLLMATLLATGLSSCSDDNDSNPVLNTKDLSLTLLEPSIPSGVLLDLSKSDTVVLKIKEQPNYGYPAVVTYSVQLSIDPAFQQVQPSEAKPDVKYTTLSQTFTTAAMKVDALELNSSIVRMYQSAHDGEDPSGKVLEAYIRVKAEIQKADGTECYSNVVKLSNLTVAYVAALPKALYLSGSAVKGGNGAKEFGPTFGLDGQFYTLAYFAAGDTFLWGDSEDADTGYSRTSSVDDQAEAGISEGEDGSFVVQNAGWYVLYMTFAVDKAKNTLLSDLTVYPGSAYVIGGPTGSDWTDSNPDWQMTAPATADGIWVSPEFVASGELRAYIKVPGIEWWHTEFTLFKGALYWRIVDIPANWAENAGDAYSVACSVGQRLYVNFDELTGEVK